MADIELVIKIPEWKYKSICEGVEASKRGGVVGVAPTIYEAIYNGTPLPKRHGRLIDADKLNIYDVSPADGFVVMGVAEEDIDLAPTIIEADKEVNIDEDSN